jgi:hypothetical protein
MSSWSPWLQRWSTTAWALAANRTCSPKHSERSAMLDARHPRSVLTAESGDGPCGTLVAPVHADVAVPAYPDDATVHIGDVRWPNASRSRRTTAPTRQGHAGPPVRSPEDRTLRRSGCRHCGLGRGPPLRRGGPRSTTRTAAAARIGLLQQGQRRQRFFASTCGAVRESAADGYTLTTGIRGCRRTRYSSDNW